MSAPDDRALDALLVELLDLEPGQRHERLQQVVDPEQRARLGQLLAGALAEDDFLTPGGALAPHLLEQVLAGDDGKLVPGTVLGAYRVLEAIGAGGMGVVYLGERHDGLFERRVAIKVVGLDSFGAPAPAADPQRLLREHHVLAGLIHPNIAQLYDAGLTEDGRPYLVMEHVVGEPIDSHCRRLGLDARARLRLLSDVCAAVQAAHQRLIVHRDLKPANILVDTVGLVKLLDFGIARFLDPEALPVAAEPVQGGVTPRDGEPAAGDVGTTLARSWLTPNYASPEQLAGLPVTTASDVFQLGLLTWELLAGRRPSRDELLGEVGGRVGPPAATSATAGAARLGVPPTDLDAVLARALAVDPGERYPSADRLREDIVALLGGWPVSARPATTAYTLRRFFGRHRLGSLAALGAVGLVVGLSAGFLVRLAAERDATRLKAEEAERASAETQQVVDFLADLFRSSDPYASSRRAGLAADVSVRELLDRSTARIDKGLRDQPRVRARLLTVVGGIYRKLGLVAEAEPLLREALRLRELEPAANRRDLAESWLALGRLEHQRGAAKVAAPLLIEAVAFYREQGDRAALAGALEALGNVQHTLREDGALVTLRESLELWQELGVGEREADLHSFLARALARDGRFEEAQQHHERSLALLEQLVGPEHPSVATALVSLADFYSQVRQPERALPLLERALGVFEKAFGPEDFRTAIAANNLGVAYSGVGDYARARRHLERALAGYERWLPEHPDVGEILNNLGTIDWAEGKPRDAAVRYRAAIAKLLGSLPEDHLTVARTVFNLGEALLALGEVAEAERHLETSLTNIGAKLGDEHVMLSWPQLYLARIAADRGDGERATALARRALELRASSLGGEAKETVEAREGVAALLRRFPAAG